MKLTKLIAAVTLSVASASAMAIPVALNVVNGAWTDSEGGQNVTLHDGGQEIRWGGNESRSKKSGYRFDANPDVPLTFDTDELFSLGTFTHYNKPIPQGSAISAATLSISTELNILGSSITDGPYNFNFTHDETLNNAPNGESCSWFFFFRTCTPRNDGPVADIVMLDSAVQSDEFTVGSYIFSMEILGFYDIQTNSLINELNTQEGTATSAKIYAKLNVREAPIQVSEPASVALLGISLVGLALHRRRRTA